MLQYPGTGANRLCAIFNRQIEVLDRIDCVQRILRREALSVACLLWFKE